jgi:hypothetical protein
MFLSLVSLPFLDPLAISHLLKYLVTKTQLLKIVKFPFPGHALGGEPVGNHRQKPYSTVDNHHTNSP